MSSLPGAVAPLAGGLVGVGGGLAGAPWWAVGVSIVMGFGVTALQAVFPQDSADRLTWWKDRRRHCEQRMRQRARAAAARGPSDENHGNGGDLYDRR